jgi:hypothetical protein
VAKTTKEQARDTTPAQLPETTPQNYPALDYSFTLQAIMEMQKTLGQLSQAVTTLTEESKKNSEKIGTISHQVYAAKVVVIVVGAILGAIGSGAIYLLCEAWKVIYPFLQAKAIHP